MRCEENIVHLHIGFLFINSVEWNLGQNGIKMYIHIYNKGMVRVCCVVHMQRYIL